METDKSGYFFYSSNYTRGPCLARLVLDSWSMRLGHFLVASCTIPTIHPNLAPCQKQLHPLSHRGGALGGCNF